MRVFLYTLAFALALSIGARSQTIYAPPPTALTYARSTSQPGNPAGATTATAVMMGLAGTITPSATGKLSISIGGTIGNATAVGDGAVVQVRFGTGGAPANQAALTGTQCGTSQSYVASTTAGVVPFNISCYVTGLAVGTAVWIDAALADTVGGTALITAVNIVALEQ